MLGTPRSHAAQIWLNIRRQVSLALKTPTKHVQGCSGSVVDSFSQQIHLLSQNVLRIAPHSLRLCQPTLPSFPLSSTGVSLHRVQQLSLTPLAPSPFSLTAVFHSESHVYPHHGICFSENPNTNDASDGPRKQAVMTWGSGTASVIVWWAKWTLS